MYLPCCSNDNLQEFNQYLSLIDGIVTSADTRKVCVLGDFNADPSKPNLFGDELTKFLQEESYILSDVIFCNKATLT